MHNFGIVPDRTRTPYNYYKVLTFTFIFALLIAQSALAAQANFKWTPNNTSGYTGGYKICYGTSSRMYTELVDVGSPTPIDGSVHASVFQLAPGQKYFFAVVAYNADGYESSYSNEIAYTMPSDAVNSSLYDIYGATSSSLSGAIALDGAKVEGDIYVFTGPDAGVARVTFSVDGVVAQTESVAPFELVGGAAFDTSKMSSGTHQITANILLKDGSAQVVRAVFTIPKVNDSLLDTSQVNDSLYDLLVSGSPSLSSAVALDGATVEGDIYVFTGPDAGVARVTFAVDGVVAQTESVAPFELVGGDAFDTSQMSSGTHQITANILLKDGSTQLVRAVFTIPKVNDSRYNILVSESSYLSSAIPLDGTTVGGDIYVFTGPDTGVSRVTFSIDGVVAQTESVAPFELLGGAAFDTSKLSHGTHDITANILLKDGSSEQIVAEFMVQ